jgi:hypothetical protein
MGSNRSLILEQILQIQVSTKHADQWFSECDEGLCSECGNNFPKISMPSRDHGVISVENYHKLPSSISESCNHCEYHDMPRILHIL